MKSNKSCKIWLAIKNDVLGSLFTMTFDRWAYIQYIVLVGFTIMEQLWKQ